MRHRSAIGEGRNLPDNERLEFLGDAVLDTVVGQFVYRQYPDKGEGFLTRMRSKLVSRHQLGILARKVEIERVLEVNIGGGQHSSVQGNAMEALFGALFIDKGFDRTRDVMINLIATHFDLKEVEQEDRDSKSRLLEWGQKQHKKVEFIVAEEHGSRGKHYTAQVQVEGKPCGSGTGHSKKRAEQEAAREASQKLRIPARESDGPDGQEARRSNDGPPRRRPAPRRNYGKRAPADGNRTGSGSKQQ